MTPIKCAYGLTGDIRYIEDYAGFWAGEICTSPSLDVFDFPPKQHFEYARILLEKRAEEIQNNLVSPKLNVIIIDKSNIPFPSKFVQKLLQCK